MKKRNGKFKDYTKSLIESLRDPAAAQAYLDAALEDGDKEGLRLAIQDISEAMRSTRFGHR